MVDGVVGGVGRPSRCEAEDARTERESGADFGAANGEGDIVKLSRAGEFPEHDEEDDETGDPAVEFVGVHNFIAEESNEEGASCDNNDAAPTGDVAVDCVQDLSAYDDVDGGPADAG